VCVYVCGELEVNSSMSVCVSLLLKENDELSTPTLIHICSVAYDQQALTLRSKGQGQCHKVMKCATGMGMHVDMIP